MLTPAPTFTPSPPTPATRSSLVVTKRAGRSKINGKGRQKKLHRRRFYTNQFKQDVLEFYNTSKDIAATIALHFPRADASSARSSERKLVYKWNARREQIAASSQHWRTATQSRSRDLGLGTTLPADAEQLLVKWINDYRRDGVPISTAMLSLQAFEIADEFNVSRDAFSASWQWQRGFMRRHKFSFRAKTHQGQIAPPDALQRAVEFAREVARIAAVEDVKVIYNADQTGVCFELLPRRTLSPTGTNTVWVKCGKKEKERMTAMLLGDTNGKKHPLFLMMKSPPSKTPDVRLENARIRHGFGKRVWAEVSQLQQKHNMQIYGNQSAWWNSSMTMQFLRFHFGERSISSDPVMLLLDDFSGHWTSEVKEYAAALRILLVKVPPGLTWICQPADVVWIKPVKDRLRRYWVEFLRQQLTTHSATRSGIAFEMKAPVRSVVAAWISDAWNDIKSSVIKAGFRKCMVDLTQEAAAYEEDDSADDQASIDEVVQMLEDLLGLDSSVGELADIDDVVDGHCL